MISITEQTVAIIQELNDKFRTTFRGGEVLITRGVNALPQRRQQQLLEKVRTYNDFTEDNDPYGTHEFGIIKQNNVIYYWKIDCYDKDMIFGSPEPADEKVTTRVLTILQADEY